MSKATKAAAKVMMDNGLRATLDTVMKDGRQFKSQTILLPCENKQSDNGDCTEDQMADGQLTTKEQDVESERPKQIMKRKRENKQPDAADCIDTLEEQEAQGDKPKQIKKRQLKKR